jgi:hypothetical protein
MTTQLLGKQPLDKVHELYQRIFRDDRQTKVTSAARLSCASLTRLFCPMSPKSSSTTTDEPASAATPGVHSCHIILQISMFTAERQYKRHACLLFLGHA